MRKSLLPDERLSLVHADARLTVKRQCELLDVNRSSFYYQPITPGAQELELEEYIKQRLDYWHTLYCYFGSRKLLNKLRIDDKIEGLGRDLIRRYMAEIGIYAVYPKPNLSLNGAEHKKFPYLLRGKSIWLPNQVWATDITYIKMGRSHMYLIAIIDWYSRFIIGWALSDTLETAPVLECMINAFEKHGIPGIINSDQGSQFTSDDYISFLSGNSIQQSMDGKARWVDNVIIERWFRSLKTENIYITEYLTPRELRLGITQYIHEYNYERPHQSLDGHRPWHVYSDVFKNE
jgi:putative transposase